MTPRRIPCAAAAAATVVLSLGAVPAAHATALSAHHTTGLSRPGRQVVSPGESIQAAVDQARPGDTVVILPGTYTGSVRITIPRVTLQGSGAETVIVPGADTGRDACARAGDGICVAGTAEDGAEGVRLRDLTVRGFHRNGIDATYADGLQVVGVAALDNGAEGISEQRSIRGVFRDDTARGNGQAGILIANTIGTEAGALDTRGTAIRADELAGNRMGIVLRRVQHVDVERNLVTANCGGVFIIGDENTPRGGRLNVVRNEISANNKYCAADGRLPFIQGTGVLLTGTDKVHVADNRVIDNTGTSPMSGGIVLYRSSVGVHDTRNVVAGNTMAGNAPADLAVRDNGTGNTFEFNTCGSAVPAVPGRCQA